MDAVAALRCWAYETTFLGVVDEHGGLVVFRIPPLPAADWISATVDPQQLSYLPGMLDDDQQEILMNAVEDGLVSTLVLQDANRDALEQMSGWAWYSAGRLIGTLVNRWETTGAVMAVQGIDPSVSSLGAYLAAFYGWMWSNVAKEDQAKLAAQVAMPPADLTRDGEWDEDAATDAVWAFMKAQGHNIQGG